MWNIHKWLLSTYHRTFSMCFSSLSFRWCVIMEILFVTTVLFITWTGGCVCCWSWTFTIYYLGDFCSCPQDAAQDDAGFSQLLLQSKCTDRIQGWRKLMDSCSRVTRRQICIYTLQMRMLWQIQTKACGFFSAMQGNTMSFAVIYTTWGDGALPDETNKQPHHNFSSFALLCFLNLEWCSLWLVDRSEPSQGFRPGSDALNGVYMRLLGLSRGCKHRW